jgi:CheY-like chemotaxis protein
LRDTPTTRSAIPGARRRPGVGDKIFIVVSLRGTAYRQASKDLLILIVDDNNDIAELIVRLLRLGGLEAMHASSAAKALKLLHDCPTCDLPSLMILDVAMPGMNGIDCLRAIRAEPAWATLPVVMYTADFSVDRMQEAMRLGAAEYVIKSGAPWGEFLEMVRKHNRTPCGGA